VEALAAVAPDWLPRVVDVANWGRRCGARVVTWRLLTSKVKRAELVFAYGSDAVRLLRAVDDPGAPVWLRALLTVEVLRRALVQNYVITTDAARRELIRARADEQDRSPARQNPVEDHRPPVEPPNRATASHGHSCRRQADPHRRRPPGVNDQVIPPGFALAIT
jgi:hypothetical protein